MPYAPEIDLFPRQLTEATGSSLQAVDPGHRARVVRRGRMRLDALAAIDNPLRGVNRVYTREAPVGRPHRIGPAHAHGLQPTTHHGAHSARTRHAQRTPRRVGKAQGIQVTPTAQSASPRAHPTPGGALGRPPPTPPSLRGVHARSTRDAIPHAHALAAPPCRTRTPFGTQARTGLHAYAMCSIPTATPPR